MALFKCKMCGGDLEILPGMTVCRCEYCNTSQTVPTAESEKKLSLFNRANLLRYNSEFDKAASLYESIVVEFPAESEAYWGLVLCKFGIEYVDDPATGKKVPTCHRTVLGSVFDDADFQKAMDCADAVAAKIYRDEAKEIDRIQRSILDIVKNEQPYDVFICYKETAEDGQRTKDSVMAQDIYDALTAKGYKVFFARITLEDKLGQEYEPYIFAALSSAKIMLSIGTCYEHFNAVWVKNEWSRFLAMMKTDKSKVLIPCYCDIDAYDMPQEFKNLQGQDMGKVGFIQDLVRGVGKIIPAPNDKNSAPVHTQTVVQQVVSSNAENLLKRGMLALEEGKWDEADKFFEQVLNENVEEPRAYFGKMLCSMKARSEERLLQTAPREYVPLKNNENYNKALRFAGDEYRAYLRDLNTRYVYSSGKNSINSAKKEKDFLAAKAIFDMIPEYQPAMEKSAECDKRIEQIQVAEKESKYQSALGILTSDSNTEDDLNNAISRFRQISGWKDSEKRITECQARIDEIRRENERKRIEREQEAERLRLLAEKTAKKHRKITAIIFGAVTLITVFLVILFNVIIPNRKYNDAVSLMNDGKYTEAISAFEAMDGYKDSAELIMDCNYNYAVSLMNEEKYDEAITAFTELNGYKESADQIADCQYNIAVSLMNEGKYTEAISAFTELNGYKDSKDQIYECQYRIAVSLMDQGNYQEAISLFTELNGYKDSTERTFSYYYDTAVSLMNESRYAEAISAFMKSSDYKDSKKQIKKCQESLYNLAVSLMNESRYTDAIILLQKSTDYKKSKELLMDCLNRYPNDLITGGINHTVAIKSDGTVVAVGSDKNNQCNVSSWKNIIAVSAGERYTIALKSDGTVVATGINSCGQCDVLGWKDIVSVSAGGNHTVALKSDGTVVAQGVNFQNQCDVSSWKNIIAVSAGVLHTVGLKADGTVIATGDNKDSQCDVSEWKDIIAVSAGLRYTVGLKPDGTVVATGSNYHNQCDVANWNNIVAISVGELHTVGLKADGTVVATGDNEHGQCNVLEWKDIVAIAAGDDFTVGLKSDGTVVAIGNNKDGQCDVSNWKNIKTTNN